MPDPLQVSNMQLQAEVAQLKAQLTESGGAS